MRHFTAADLGLGNIDLQVLATTTSPLIIPAPDQFQFQAVMSKTLAAGTAITGLGSIGFLCFSDAAGLNAIFSQALVNTIDLKLDSTAVGGTREVVTFGASGAENSGSGALASGAGAARVIPFIQLFFTVSEVVDVVATAVGDMTFQMEGFNR